jgi:CheY-like chemotaxis protein
MRKAVILYVEDEEDDLFFMRRAFKRFDRDVALHAAPHGKEAIAYLNGDRTYGDREQFPLPDLILLDLNLPVLSGFEVLQWIREQSRFEGVPVVVFSSSGREDDLEKARELKANDYVLKPTSGLAFAEVAQLLRQRWLSSQASDAPQGT